MRITDSPDEAELIIQKLPSDMGIHRNPRKGTLNGPKKILEEFRTDRKVLIDEVFPDEFDLEETHGRIEENTRDFISYGKPIFSLGGDHSVSFPAIKALKEEFPDLQLVWLDAHLDLKEKVEGHISHDVVVRELLNGGFSEDEIWFVGVTKIDDDERIFLEAHDLKVFNQDQIGDFFEQFESDGKPVYLSVDIDVLKKELAPGTGYPDGKLDLEDVKEVIEKVEPDYADLVEVAPSLDNEDRTVQSAAKIAKSISEKI